MKSENVILIGVCVEHAVVAEKMSCEKFKKRRPGKSNNKCAAAYEESAGPVIESFFNVVFEKVYNLWFLVRRKECRSEALMLECKFISESTIKKAREETENDERKSLNQNMFLSREKTNCLEMQSKSVYGSFEDSGCTNTGNKLGTDRLSTDLRFGSECLGADAVRNTKREA